MLHDQNTPIFVTCMPATLQDWVEAQENGHRVTFIYYQNNKPAAQLNGWFSKGRCLIWLLGHSAPTEIMRPHEIREGWGTVEPPVIASGGDSSKFCEVAPAIAKATSEYLNRPPRPLAEAALHEILAAFDMVSKGGKRNMNARLFRAIDRARRLVQLQESGQRVENLENVRSIQNDK